MRDIIDSEIEVLFSALNWVSQNKIKIIENYCLQNIEFSKTTPDNFAAYFISANQNDPSALNVMLNFLNTNGVAIYHPGKTVRVEGQEFTAPDYVIPKNQPGRKFIDYVLKDSTAGFQLPARHGVKVVEMAGETATPLIEAKHISQIPAAADLTQKGDYLILNNSNDAYKLINRFFDGKKTIFQLREEMKVGGYTFPPGTLYIPKDEIKVDEFKTLAKDLMISVKKIDFDFRAQKAFRLHRPRNAIYQSWIANPDEGWTRFVLSQHNFLSESLYGSKIRTGNLNQYDVIILPDMKPELLASGWAKGESDFTPPMPRPYLDAIAAEGVANLKKFVKDGGTLIALGRACDFVNAEFMLPFERVSARANPDEATTGRIISIINNNKNPLGFGMPETAHGIFTGDFFLQPTPWPGETQVVAYLSNPVQAANGQPEQFKEKLPAVMEIPMGGGKIILMLIRPQFRGQIPVTYKLLFNSILKANSENVIL
jgi:hypothetical protein